MILRSFLLVCALATLAPAAEWQPYMDLGWWDLLLPSPLFPWPLIGFVGLFLFLDHHLHGIVHVALLRGNGTLHQYFLETERHPGLHSWALSSHHGPASPHTPLMILGGSQLLYPLVPLWISYFLAILTLALASRFAASHWAFRIAQQPFGKDWVPCRAPANAPPETQPLELQVYQTTWWRRGDEVRSFRMPGPAFCNHLSKSDSRTRMASELHSAPPATPTLFAAAPAVARKPVTGRARVANLSPEPATEPIELDPSPAQKPEPGWASAEQFDPTFASKASNASHPGDLDADSLARLTGLSPLQAAQALVRKPESGWADFEAFARDARLSPHQANHCRPLLVFPPLRPDQPAPPTTTPPEENSRRLDL